MADVFSPDFFTGYHEDFTMKQQQRFLKLTAFIGLLLASGAAVAASDCCGDLVDCCMEMLDCCL